MAMAMATSSGWMATAATMVMAVSLTATTAASVVAAETLALAVAAPVLHVEWRQQLTAWRTRE